MGAPTVSVIIPTHNRAGQCRNAVMSAVEQTLPPNEILVCDDGSTDETQEVIHEIARAEPSVRLIRSNNSAGGPGAPRNSGIQLASGEYVAFLDDDDSWHRRKLEAQLDSVSDSATIVCTNALRSSGGTYFDDDRDRSFGFESLTAGNPVIVSSALVRRERLLEVGGFHTPRVLTGCEDYDLWLRLVNPGEEIVRLGEPLVTYDDGSGVRLSNQGATMAMAEAAAFVRAFATRKDRRGLLRPTANRLVLAAVAVFEEASGR